jgi:hypothetical protein
MTAPLRLVLLSAALAIPAATGALAQTAFKLDGACEKLVVADRDVSAQCSPTMTNGVSRNRTTFDFTTKDGQVVSFSGNGAQQEATEETDPLQPINVVSESKSGSEVGAPVLAIGACRFSTPAEGRTSIECEAKTADGRAYAGTFVTAAKAAPGAPVPKPR